VNRSTSVLLVLAILSVAVLNACGSDDSGGSSTADKAAAPSAQTSTQATTPPAATGTRTSTAAATPATNAAAVDKCHAMLDPYVTMLHEIEDSVDDAPDFKTYNAAVGKLVDNYSNNFNAVNIPSPSCGKSVVRPITGAYVKYFLATQKWTDCRKQQRCSARMADLRERWTAASAYIKSADKGFSSVSAR
jgi:hypothetical protein